ncbi:MAG: response regulator [Chloroflexi bacterium]|nr:MAG: response regulator [Chloroflexota bacterium]
MPDSPDLSSALGEAVHEGRQFLARVESMAEALSVELASHEEAGRQWAAERQAIKAEEDRLRQTLRTVNETIAAERGRLAKLEEELEAVRREREQATADRDLAATDRDRARQAVEVAEREVAGVREKLQAAEQVASGLHAQLATSAADTARLRDQLGMVTRDRDTLQTDQIQWGLDRERLLAELNELKESGAALARGLAAEREQHQALQGRHAELSEQSNKLASDWGARRQALAAEIHAQNEEMQQVRKALQESQERERHGVGTGPMTIPTAGLSIEQSHLINSRLNALVGFSSVLLDERAHALTVEERREYLKYLHESAVKLSEVARSLTGGKSATADAPSVVDRDRRPPDILVADNDQVSRQRIEPFLKRAGYEVVYVDNTPRALEKATHMQPLAILIDAQLPPNGAPAMIRELRKDPRTRDIPLVVLAAPDAPPVAVAEGEVLTKPIDRQQLVQLMVRFDLMADGKRAKKMPANVLVIDDDLQAVSLVKAILKPFNVRVNAVDNARAGIEQALRNKPDLVILDLVMPGADGFEVVAALRRDKEMSRVPILVHTAKTLTAEDRQRLEGTVESIVEKAEFQPERFLELLLKRGERRKRAA